MIRLSATAQPSPRAWTISGLMSSSEISGWLHTMQESRSKVSNDCVDVGWGVAAETVEHLEGADLAHHPLCGNLPHRRQTEGDIFEHLHERPAEAEHHQRPEPRIAARPKDHFDPFARHLLNQDAIDPATGMWLSTLVWIL